MLVMMAAVYASKAEAFPGNDPSTSKFFSRSGLDSCRPQHRLRLGGVIHSLLSPKTLNPNILEILLFTKAHQRISSLVDSSLGSSSYSSCLLQEKTFLINSSCGTSLLSCFGLFYTQRLQLLDNSPSGSTTKGLHHFCVPYKNRFAVNSPNWLASGYKFGSCSCNQNRSLCFSSSSHRSNIYSCRHLFSRRLGSLTSLMLYPYLGCSNLRYLYYGITQRFFNVSSSIGTFGSGPVTGRVVQSVAIMTSKRQELDRRKGLHRNVVLEIVSVLRNNGNDLESRVTKMAPRLSVYTITEIFELLNSQRIPGFRLFEWIQSNNPKVRRNARICSFIIDNFGRLDDYDNMLAMFKKFTSERICLTYEAFVFLPVLASTDSSLIESTKRVVDLLNKAGGSCRNSGFCALVEMFCKFDLFEMSRYVIQITERKASYFHLMIREKCKRDLLEDAYGLIREMEEANFAPSTTAYNYILGSLYKTGRTDEASALLNTMKEVGIQWDTITFEIVMNLVCSLGKFNDAHRLLEQMASQEIEPRPTTYACLIKALFAMENYDAAHKYIADSGTVYRTSSNMMYRLMATLYRKKGDIVRAQEVLVEMMDKRLKPDFNIYMDIVKQLNRNGRGNLGRELQHRYSQFVNKPCAG